MSITGLLLDKGVAYGRSGSPGAALRGWRIDSAALVAEPTAAAVVHALQDLVLPLDPDQIVGIERAGTPLATRLSALAPNDRPLPAIRYSPRGADHWPDAPPEGRVILLDDVVNTGRTAALALRHVIACNAEVVALACLVQYPKRRPVFLRRWPGPIVTLTTLTELHLPYPVRLPMPRRARTR